MRNLNLGEQVVTSWSGTQWMMISEAFLIHHLILLFWSHIKSSSWQDFVLLRLCHATTAKSRAAQNNCKRWICCACASLLPSATSAVALGLALPDPACALSCPNQWILLHVLLFVAIVWLFTSQVHKLCTSGLGLWLTGLASCCYQSCKGLKKHL